MIIVKSICDQWLFINIIGSGATAIGTTGRIFRYSERWYLLKSEHNFGIPWMWQEHKSWIWGLDYPYYLHINSIGSSFYFTFRGSSCRSVVLCSVARYFSVNIAVAFFLFFFLLSFPQRLSFRSLFDLFTFRSHWVNRIQEIVYSSP